MKNKNIKLLFTLKQWLSSEVLRCIPSKDREIPEGLSESYQKEMIAENKEKAKVREFFTELKAKRAKNKKAIDEAYGKPDPFPELIPFPDIHSISTDGKKWNLIEKRIFREMEKFENKDAYMLLLENNKIPCYTELIDKILSEREKIYFTHAYEEDPHINIFRHAILMCPPANVQSQIELLKEEYDEVNKIDSKTKSKEKEEELRYNFHKSLRQCDPLGNPHAEMIIWELLQITDIPHRIIKAVIKHTSKVKELV